MNYSYPNYYQYGNNPYMQPYNQYNGYQQIMPQQSAQVVQQNSSQTPQYPTIVGKFVENSDIVKVSECPIGGYSVFPLNDMSQVFIKAYDKNGNLQTMTYSLNKDIDVQSSDMYLGRFDELSELITRLDKKIDSIKPLSSTQKRKKVEVEDDDE